MGLPKASHNYACGVTDTTDGGTDPVIYVDVPDPETIGDGENGWVNVGRFKTKAEALAWIRENIGPCDDEGNINLLVNA